MTQLWLLICKIRCSRVWIRDGIDPFWAKVKSTCAAILMLPSGDNKDGPVLRSCSDCSGSWQERARQRWRAGLQVPFDHAGEAPVPRVHWLWIQASRSVLLLFNRWWHHITLDPNGLCLLQAPPTRVWVGSKTTANPASDTQSHH